MEYGASRFPMLSRFFLTANEKDFSLALEMTVWGSDAGTRLSLLPMEGGAPKGGGWLTQRNKKEWRRSIFSYHLPKHSRGRFFRLPLAFPFVNETP